MIQVPSRVLVIIRSWLCVTLALACQCGPTGAYFTTYQAAVVHYARSTACHQSLRGIATVVLPKRPADAEASGSGAAGGWAGPSKLAGGPTARPCPSMTGASILIVYDLVICIVCPVSYTGIVKKTAISHTISGEWGTKKGFETAIS